MYMFSFYNNSQTQKPVLPGPGFLLNIKKLSVKILVSLQKIKKPTTKEKLHWGVPSICNDKFSFSPQKSNFLLTVILLETIS